MKLGNWGKDADRPIDLVLTAKGHAALARPVAQDQADDTDEDD